MRVYIVRHGETVDNVSNTIQGQQNGLLNENGVEQAGRIADELKSISFDYKICSDLGRCVNTFKIINSKLESSGRICIFELGQLEYRFWKLNVDYLYIGSNWGFWSMWFVKIWIWSKIVRRI